MFSRTKGDPGALEFYSGWKQAVRQTAIVEADFLLRLNYWISMAPTSIVSSKSELLPFGKVFKPMTTWAIAVNKIWVSKLQILPYHGRNYVLNC